MNVQIQRSVITAPKENDFRFQWKITKPKNIVGELVSPVFYAADHEIRVKVDKSVADDETVQGSSKKNVDKKVGAASAGRAYLTIFTTMPPYDVLPDHFVVTIWNDCAQKKVELTIEEIEAAPKPTHVYWRGSFDPAAVASCNHIVIEVTVNRRYWLSETYELNGGLTPTNALHAVLFANRLANLWTNGDFTDCELVVGNVVFQAHKAVLAGCSTVLRDQFRTSDRVVVDRSVEPEVFQKFLNCIYTGRVGNLHQDAVHLLVLADLYRVTGLRLVCASYLDDCVQRAHAALRMPNMTEDEANRFLENIVIENMEKLGMDPSKRTNPERLESLKRVYNGTVRSGQRF